MADLVAVLRLVQLHQDVEDVHEEVDNVHVQLDGTFHVVIHLELVGNTPGIIDQISAEDGGACEGDDEA